MFVTLKLAVSTDANMDDDWNIFVNWTQDVLLIRNNAGLTVLTQQLALLMWTNNALFQQSIKLTLKR